MKKIKIEKMDFDVSDAPQEPMAPRKKSPPPVPHRRDPGKKMGAPHAYNPGMPPERKTEATPFGGPDKRQIGAAAVPPVGGERRRARSDTSQFQMRPGTPLQKPSLSAGQAQTGQGESSWDVYVDGAGVYKVPASDEQSAKDRAAEWLNSGGDPDHAGKTFDAGAFQAVKAEASFAASAGPGPQRQLSQEGLEMFRSMVNSRIQEIVRKKAGGGGYNLYAPNKGKKKNPKPVGEFPTRMAAKRAELARFPPKDPEQLKRTRARLDKLSKDPKKRIEKEKEELGSRTKGHKGKSEHDRKSRKESIISRMANDISESLFREDELPGSPWDERISSLRPDALASDKKLHRHHQGMQKASLGALGDGHKTLAKVLRGIAKVQPGDVSHDQERNKMFMPLTLDVDGEEIGPIHLYIDGGHVCIEISNEAREMIGGLESTAAKNLRGGLMSFQEDHLPKIDKARSAWSERDTYLDKLHKKLEKQVGGMSPVELHLVRQLMNKGRRR